MQPQMTGFPNGMQQQPFLQPQQTGAMAFGNQQPMFQPSQPFQPSPQQPFMQSNQTGFQAGQPGMQLQQTGFLQSQSTGPNPFRQSVMATGNSGAPFSQPASPFGQSSQAISQNIQRSGSTPVKPLVSQPTGSKNPFAPAPGQAQKAATVSSRGPTMNELAMGFGRDQSQQQPTHGQSPWATVNGKSSNGTGIADVASSFVFDAPKTSNNNDDFLSQFGGLSVNTSTGPTTNTNSTASPSNQFSFNNAFGAQNASSPSTEFLQPQQTGFGGSAIKPFKPTSSFGSQLLDGLGPVASPTASPGVGTSPQAHSGGVQAQSTGFPGMGGAMQQNQFGAANAGGMGQQGTGVGGQQSQGQGQLGALGGMGQQATGANGGGQQNQFGGFGSVASQSTGQPNPFRQSTMSPGGGGMGNLAFGQGQGAFGANSPFAGQNNPQFGQGQGQTQGQGGYGQQGGSLI